MLSIIIPTFNRREIVKETLQNLSDSGELREYAHEIIVVNDGSVELSDLENAYDGLNVRVVKNTGKGAAAARNFGAKTASYELLLFIDDDILPVSGAISQIIEFHKNNRNCLLSGTWIYSPEVLQNLQRTPFGRFKIENDYVCMGGVEKKPLAENLYESESLASFCLSATKETYEKIGGFNENFPFAGCEDQEFSIKAGNLGVKLNYLTSVKTYHNELDRGDKQRWMRRQFTGIQGFPLLCEIYPERKKSPLYRENVPLAKEDDLKLKIKKAFKKIAYGKAGFYTLNVLTGALEKTFAAQTILNRFYRLMGGMMIYQGFQIGRRNLPDLEKTSPQTQKNRLA